MRTTPFIQTAGKPVISGRSIDDKKPLKAIFIGAGVSGIIAGIKLPQYTQNLDIVIYDKNPEIGGTWWENRYPGCACGQSVLPKCRRCQCVHRLDQTFPLIHINYRLNRIRRGQSFMLRHKRF